MRSPVKASRGFGAGRAAAGLLDCIRLPGQGVVGAVRPTALSLALAVLVAAPLRAHDPGLSTTQVVVEAGRVAAVIGFAPGDLRPLLPADARPAASSWSAADFNSLAPTLKALAPRLFEIRTEGGAVAWSTTSVTLESGNSVLFHLAGPRPAAPRLTFRSLVMERMPPGHRDYLAVTDGRGRTLLEKLLSAADPQATLEWAPAAEAGGAAPAPEAVVPSFWGFLRLGIAHIWTGYDHLLFLFGLLVVCRSFRSIVAIISCFTRRPFDHAGARDPEHRQHPEPDRRADDRRLDLLRRRREPGAPRRRAPGPLGADLRLRAHPRLRLRQRPARTRHRLGRPQPGDAALHLQPGGRDRAGHDRRHRPADHLAIAQDARASSGAGSPSSPPSWRPRGSTGFSKGRCSKRGPPPDRGAARRSRTRRCMSSGARPWAARRLSALVPCSTNLSGQPMRSTAVGQSASWRASRTALPKPPARTWSSSVTMSGTSGRLAEQERPVERA